MSIIEDIIPPNLPSDNKPSMIRDDSGNPKKRMSTEKKQEIYHLCVYIFLDILCVLGLYAIVISFIYHNDDFITQFLPFSIFLFALMATFGIFGAILLSICVLETIGELIAMD